MVLLGAEGDSAQILIATSDNSTKTIETNTPALLNFIFTSDRSFSLISSVPLGATPKYLGQFVAYLATTLVWHSVRTKYRTVIGSQALNDLFSEVGLMGSKIVGVGDPKQQICC